MVYSAAPYCADLAVDENELCMYVEQCGVKRGHSITPQQVQLKAITVTCR